MEARPLFQLADSALEVVEQRESTTRPPHPLGQAIDPGNQALNLVGHRANDAFPGFDREHLKHTQRPTPSQGSRQSWPSEAGSVGVVAGLAK